MAIWFKKLGRHGIKMKPRATAMEVSFVYIRNIMHFVQLINEMRDFHSKRIDLYKPKEEEKFTQIHTEILK